MGDISKVISPLTQRRRTASAATNNPSLDISVTKFLREHVLFKDVKDEKFIDKLASNLQIRLYADRDSVIKKGEVGRAMFFILKGQVEVISEDGETTSKIMDEQEFFGEIGVLFSVPRTVSCRTRGRCILLILTKDALTKAFDGHPEIADSISLIAKERFSSYMKQQEGLVKVEFGEEIRLGIDQTDLKNIPLFKNCEVGFLHQLALSLSPLQYHQNDFIIRKGDVASEMYFVVKGTAEVFNEKDGKVYAEFTPGTFFGEVGLFFDIKRTASVHCVTDVTLFKLTREGLDEILLKYPEISQNIKAEAKQRFAYNQEREKISLNQKKRLQTEHEVVREKLKQIPYFKGATLGFLHQLALLCKFQEYSANETIIKKDDSGESMFFVLDGRAEVISPDGIVYAELPVNSFFGEVAMFYKINRTATVRAHDSTTALELSRTSLMSVIDQHPDLKDTMMQKAKENYDLYLSRQKKLSQLNQQNVKSGLSKLNQEAYDIESTISRLRKVPLFEKCDNSFLSQLAITTTIRRYSIGDFVVRKDEESLEMFFLIEGQVNIVSESGKIFDTIHHGGFFGEVGILRALKRTASVKVESLFCDVIILTAEALKKLSQDYSENFENIALECEKRFQIIQKRLGENEIGAKNEDNFMISISDMSEAMNVGTVHTADEFTDAIKKDKKSSKMSIGSMFKKDSSKPQTNISKEIQLGSESSSCSLDSIRDPEPKRGMKAPIIPIVPAASPTSHASLSSLSESIAKNEKEKGKGAFGKLFSSLRQTLSKRESPKSKKEGSINSEISTAFRSISSIFDLSERQFCLVMSRLDPMEKLRLRRVCKKWSEIFYYSLMWRTIDLRKLFRVVSSERLFIFAEMSNIALTSLNLTGCWQTVDDDLHLIAATCPNIATLSVSNCWKITDKGMSSISQKCTKMLNLDISYCGQLSGSFFTDHKWALLRRVELSFCKQIGDEQLESLLSKTSNIDHLSFRRCTKITDFGLFLVVRYCRKLLYLDLNDCEHISDKCLKWIASSCTRLAYLNLRFCTKITNGGLYDLSLGVQNFLSLNLEHCLQLTDASIIFFSDNIKSLQFMYLRRCRKLTENSAQYLVRTSPNLSILDLRGCPNMTGQIIPFLLKTAPKLQIRIDSTREMRGIKSPLERGENVAKEVAVNRKYTSGPRDVMRGLKVKKHSNVSSDGTPTRKKKSHKPPSIVD